MFERLKEFSRKFKAEVRVYQLAVQDPRTPKTAKFILWLAVGYALMPFDLIPDFIPVLGQIDDVVIIPLLVVTALKLIPVEVLRDSKMKLEVSNERN